MRSKKCPHKGVYQYFTYFWKNLVPVFFTTLLQFTEVWEHFLCIVILRSHNSISLELRSGFWLNGLSDLEPLISYDNYEICYDHWLWMQWPYIAHMQTSSVQPMMLVVAVSMGKIRTLNVKFLQYLLTHYTTALPALQITKFIILTSSLKSIKLCTRPRTSILLCMERLDNRDWTTSDIFTRGNPIYE